MGAAGTRLRPRGFREEVHGFAGEVGSEGPVAAVGGRTAWSVGGEAERGVREVVAPGGIVEIAPEEMTVRVGAGLPVSELDAALAEVGQEVVLGGRPGGTVGGALVVGWSSIRRLGVGPVRDVLLEAAVVGADGRPFRAGGPTVKNVTGYDLCRLLVGSLGTLGLVAEVLLRTRPLPATSVWVEGEIDPAIVDLAVVAPVAHLWDGTARWFLLEGHDRDVSDGVTALERAGGQVSGGPPPLPPHRWSVDPGRLQEVVAAARGSCVAEVGVGTVHHLTPQPRRQPPTRVRTLNARLRSLFDPTGRLNPGRSTLR